METPPPPAAPQRSSHAPWALAAAAVAIVAIVTGGALYVVRSVRRVPADLLEGGRRTLHELREVAAAFRSGTVTTSFRGYATEARGTTRLEFAVLRELEVFERRDEAAVLWGALRLPDVVIEARAPIEYTYFVDLDKEWRFRLQDREVLVVAPRVEWNRPAVDVSALRYEVRAGSIFRDEQLVQERLRAELTALASMRARQHVPLACAAGRRKIESFVETWLVQRFADGAGYRARVRFADEPEAPAPSGPLLASPKG